MTVELSDNPADYGLPADKFPGWWPNQKRMLHASVNLEGGKLLVCESPTGSGKSLLPAVVSSFRPGVTGVVVTRDLQEQYEASFPGFAIVWGRRHYPCILPSRISQFMEAYDEAPTREDCPYNRPKDCPVISDCPYEQAKVKAMGARARVLNCAYAFFTNWWRRGPDGEGGDLFCDEAHRLPEVLAGLISVEVSDRRRKWYSLPNFPLTSGGSLRAIKEVLDWLRRAEAMLDSHFTGDERQKLQLKNFRRELKDLRDSLQVAEPGTWFVSSGMKLGRLEARPVLPGKYASRILDSHARSIVLMSATIGDPAVLLAELGMEDREYQFLTLPHIFKPENRPIIWLKKSPKMSYKSGPGIYKQQAGIIADLLRQHAGHRGLIHTASWRHAETLMRLLSTNGLASRLYLPRGIERIEAIERFKNSPEGTVAISPSWSEGLNFPDDEARFGIHAKVPFLSLADPVVKLRLESKGGRQWYEWNAALGVVQACGRIVRHQSDWGVNYICDSNWERVAKYAPKWFEVTKI